MPAEKQCQRCVSPKGVILGERVQSSASKTSKNEPIPSKIFILSLSRWGSYRSLKIPISINVIYHTGLEYLPTSAERKNEYSIA